MRVSALHLNTDGSLCLQRAETARLSGAQVPWSPPLGDLLEPRALWTAAHSPGGGIQQARRRGSPTAAALWARRGGPMPLQEVGCSWAGSSSGRKRRPRPSHPGPPCHTHTAPVAGGEAWPGLPTHPGLRLLAAPPSLAPRKRSIQAPGRCGQTAICSEPLKNARLWSAIMKGAHTSL